MQSLQEFLENYDEPYKLSVSKNIQQGSPRISNFIKDKVFDISQKIIPLAFSNLLNARDDLCYAKKDPNAFVINKRSDINNPNVNAFMGGLGINPNDKGVIYGYQSPYSKQLFMSKPLQTYINANMDSLRSKGGVKQEVIDFGNDNVKINNRADLGKWMDLKDNRYGVQHATLYNPHIDNQGYFNAAVTDKYNFELRPYNSLSDFVNNAGYYAQEAGLLENPFYMYNIHEKVE